MSTSRPPRRSRSRSGPVAPALSVYRSKRDFAKTREPSGADSVAPSDRLRFVVQKHAARRLHYDLRLELNGVFKSWAVTRGPSVDPADKRLAVEVEDHPLSYGDFEGTITAGEYGGGTVLLWDRGYWQPEGPKTPEAALDSGDLKFTLRGERLKGGWVLVRMRSDRAGKRNNWLLIKHRDAEARAGGADQLLKDEASVASGRSMEQIAAGTGQSPAPFMTAKSGRTRPDAVWRSALSQPKYARRAAALPRSAGIRPSRPTADDADRGMRARGPATRLEKSTAAHRPLKAVQIPSFVQPALCKLVDRPPAAPGWGHEVKFDGYRTQLHLTRGVALIRSRHGLDWTSRFAAIAHAASSLPDCVIDGEVVALDHENMPSFAALQSALSEGTADDLILFAFDLLFEGHEDLRPLPLSDRKRRLERLLGGQDLGGRLRYVQHFESTADTVLQSACTLRLEGIVSKKLDAPYASGRNGTWTKAKCRGDQEVVLGGWTTDGGSVRSLLAGVQREGRLVYVGRVGTGFGAQAVKLLSPRLAAAAAKASPFTGDNAPANKPNIRWLKPELVAEIEIAGWTGSGMIRQASYKGLREDKPSGDVVAEHPEPSTVVTGAWAKTSAAAAPSSKPIPRGSPRLVAARRGIERTRGGGHANSKRVASAPSRVAPHASSGSGGVESVVRGKSAFRMDSSAREGGSVVMGVALSKPDKTFWPDAGDDVPVTKRDLACYFESVGEWMIPHLRGRPCSLVRAPDGVAGPHFFQRHAMPGMSNLFNLVKIKGDREPYVQIDRIEALAAVAQLGGLELHPWNCAPGEPDVAGRLVFDLDPAEDLPFDAVVDAALEVRARLTAVGLVSFCKTTGGKGLHVVTPLLAGRHGLAWPVAKNFAHVLCAQMASDSPARYVDNMAKNRRTGRIFLDYLRNDRMSTAVAPLSPRARPGATVSMPLDWAAVQHGLAPARFTLRTAPELLRKSDAWRDYAGAGRSLAAAVQAIAPAGRKPRRATAANRA